VSPEMWSAEAVMVTPAASVTRALTRCVPSVFARLTGSPAALTPAAWAGAASLGVPRGLASPEPCPRG